MGETGHLGEYSPVKYDSAISSAEDEEVGGGFLQVYMKSIIFGSTDGVCFSMVVVSAAVGCGLEWQIVSTLCIAALAANCIVVGGGEFFSDRSQDLHESRDTDGEMELQA